MDDATSRSSRWFVLVFLLLPIPVFAEAPDALKEAHGLIQQVRSLVRARQYADALPPALKALELSRKARQPDHPDVGEAAYLVAEVYAGLREFAKAEPLYREALAVRETAFGAEDPTVAQTLSDLALLYARTSEYTKAESLFRRALTIREKAFGPDHPEVASTLNNLAVLYFFKKAYAEAEPLFRRAIAIWERVLNPEDLDLAESLNGLAAVQKSLGKDEQAMRLYERVLAIRAKVLGPDHPETIAAKDHLAQLIQQEARQAAGLAADARREAQRLDTQVKELYEAQRYVEALPLARKALERAEQGFGREHRETSVSLLNLAKLYQAMGEYAKAEPLYLRAFAIWERELGSEHAGVGAIAYMLASMYHLEMKLAAKAEPWYRRSLAIAEKALGPDHPQVESSLTALALIHSERGEYAQAESQFQRALAIKEKALGPDDPALGIALGYLARLYLDTGKFEQAEPLYQRVLAIQETSLGPDHADVAVTLTNLANVYREMGEYPRAEPLLRRALSIQDKTGVETAQTLDSLGQLYFAVGRYAEAGALFQRALRAQEDAFGPNHVDVATALDNVAVFRSNMGDYAKAEPLHQRALAIRENVLGPAHPLVATSLNNLATLYIHMGDFVKAEALLKRAVDISERALGSQHPDVAKLLGNLAMLYDETEEYSRAEPLHRRVLAGAEQAFGTDHVQVALALNNLAGFYMKTGRSAQAVPLYRRALTIFEKAVGPDHWQVAAVLANLAGPAVEKKDYGGAVSLLQRALSIQEKALGQGHPAVGKTLIGLAVTHAAHQRYSAALGFCKHGLSLQENQIRNMFAIATEEQKLKYIHTIDSDYKSCLSLIHQYVKHERDVVRYALELVLRRKGIVFDAQAGAREALQGRLSGAARKEWEHLAALRGEQARLLLNKPEPMSSEAYRERIETLQRDIEEVEQRLAKESALVAGEVKERSITVEAAAKALPRGALLVEFVKIADFDFAKGTWSPTERYLAFLLTQSGEVTLVDLGDAAGLEELARRVQGDLRAGIAGGRRSHKSLAALHQRLWAPLLPALGTAEHVILSPDGQLNLVPFAALMDPKGRPLVERYRLTYLTSGRDLLHPGGPAAQPEVALLLVADPAFDATAPSSGEAGPAVRSADLALQFAPLPGTVQEAVEIPGLVTGQPDQKRVLVKQQATERAVKAARSPRILHLATHGFFLADQPSALGTDQRGASPLKLGDAARPAGSKRIENPLVRSGLAFAGANQAEAGTEEDDGILTALEITGMDLSETELVVLSACETGVGDVKNGEGVFGLRRAFALAGARRVVMSLWPVSDAVTASQMRAFYENLRAMSPAEALRQAQLTTIRELTAKEGFANPALWAPFILQGM